jgi:hypothetical protein
MLRTNLFLYIIILSLTALPMPSHASDFTMIFSNDIRGETEPCG